MCFLQNVCKDDQGIVRRRGTKNALIPSSFVHRSLTTRLGAKLYGTRNWTYLYESLNKQMLRIVFSLFVFLIWQIIFPNGSIDPWHALGIIKDVTSSEQAVFIEGGFRCTLTRFVTRFILLENKDKQTINLASVLGYVTLSLPRGSPLTSKIVWR